MRTSIEALFDAMVNDGWANESSGNIESPTGHFARISNSLAELTEVLQAFEDVTDDYGVPAADDITGHFLVTTNEQGFIYVTRYASEAALIAAYRELETEYNAWEEN
jgi:hypothetical protein